MIDQPKLSKEYNKPEATSLGTHSSSKIVIVHLAIGLKIASTAAWKLCKFRVSTELSTYKKINNSF
jgi:hypothetical protein